MVQHHEKHPKSDWAIEFCLCFLLLLFSISAFSRGFGSEFVFDSVVIVDGDPRVTEFNAGSIVDILRENYWWPTMESNAYRPVTTFLLLVQRTVLGFGSTPANYQAVNLILHILVTIGAFKLLCRFDIPRHWAFLASLWFAVHPYVAEVVPNIVGLADLLALGSIVWGFHLYLDMLEERAKFIPGVFKFSLITVLGLLAKESAVSLLAFVLWHAATLSRAKIMLLARSRSRTEWLALAACATAILMTVLIPRLVHENFDMGEGRDIIILDNPLRGETPLVARVNAFSILGGNIINCIVPTTISADYSFGQIQLGALPPSNGADWAVLARASAVLCLGLSGLLLIFRWPAYSFAVGTVFIMAAPAGNFIILIGTIRADRLVYPYIVPVLICAGMLLKLSWLHTQNIRQPTDHTPGNKNKLAGRLAAILCGIYIILLALLTNFRATDWRTVKGFWEAAYQTSPNSFKTKLGIAGVQREPNLERINMDIELARSALEQLRASPVEVVRNADLAQEAYASCLIARARYQIDKEPREVIMPDIDDALLLYRNLLNTRLEMERLSGARRGQGKVPVLDRIKKDTILEAIADILRFKGKFEEGISLLDTYYDECALSKEYLLALARLYTEAGQIRKGLVYYISNSLLHPNDTDVAAEAAWVLKNKELPPYALAYASKERRLTRDHGYAKLNFADPELVEIIRESLRKLNHTLENRGDDALRSVVLRRVRVFMGYDLLTTEPHS